MSKIFVSYCHDDQAKMDSIVRNIKPILKHHGYTVWNDNNIITGDNLNNEVFKNLEDSTVIICLLSRDYLSSDYCIDQELDKALVKYKKDEINFFPIVLRQCSWKLSFFKDIKCQPKDGKPINDYKDHELDDVYAHINTELDRFLSEVKKKHLNP